LTALAPWCLIGCGRKKAKNILPDFDVGSKSLRKGVQGRKFFLLSWGLGFLFSATACFYTLSLDLSAPLKVTPKDYQPVALFPVKDAPSYPHSGSEIYSLIRESLEQKGYALVEPRQVSEALQEMNLAPVHLLSDPESQKKIGERLKAKLLIIAILPEYKVKKAYVGSQIYQIWQGAGTEAVPYEYWSLPTYYGGTLQIRLILRMFEAEGGSLLWRAEGTIRAPSDSAEDYARKLVERLLKDLPPMPAGPKE